MIVFGDHTRVFKYIDFPLALGADGAKALTAKDKNVYLKYIYYYFKSVNLADAGYSRHFKLLKDIQIPLPPLPEQIAIANLLSKAEALIAKRKESLALLDAYLKSMFLELFGDPVRNEKGWEIGNFIDYTDRITKGESPRWQGFEYLEKGVRFITSENVNFMKVDLAKAKFVHSDFHNKLLRSQLFDKDLLVNLVGASVGRCAIVPKDALPANINQAVAAISLKKENINFQFTLWLFSNNSFQRSLLGNVVEAARANLSLANLRELKIPLPPLELQNQFAAVVEKVEALKEKYQKSLGELEKLYGALSQRAFRGELGVGKT
jgi:type I restriction enzyme S subunit